MKLLKKRHGFAFNIIAAVAAMILLSAAISGTIGYFSFTNSLVREYTDMAFRTGRTAVTLIDGDLIDHYLEIGAEDPEYEKVRSRLDTLCNRMDTTFIYVLKADRTDYGSFVSVFNCVNEKSSYDPWPPGYVRETTNDTYRQIYRDIYEKKAESGSVFRTTDLRGNEPHLTMCVPIENDAGEVTAILCVQRPMRELVDGRITYVFSVGVATVTLLAIVVAGAAAYVRNFFVKPLEKVTSEAVRFASEPAEASEKLIGTVGSIEEINRLAESVDKMEDDMLSYIESLTKATADRERIGTELDIASRIQEGAVPSVFPAFPDRDDFDIYASMTPAKEVGGDFYDFFLIDDTHLALVMADVSGKGIPAALFMMVSSILINNRALMGGTPGEILTFANDRISLHNPADMFVTLWLGILGLKTGVVTAANAGHDDPALYRHGSGFELVKSRRGPVLGAIEGIKYRDYSFTMERGDKIFLYTDGVPEATNSANEMLGIDNMTAALNECAQGSPKEIIDSMWNRVKEFTGDAPQFDDVTMLCVELKGDD